MNAAMVVKFTTSVLGRERQRSPMRARRRDSLRRGRRAGPEATSRCRSIEVNAVTKDRPSPGRRTDNLLSAMSLGLGRGTDNPEPLSDNTQAL